MDVLTKIKSASILETMVASLLVLLVFFISSESLNNVFKNKIKVNQKATIETKLHEIKYLFLHQVIDVGDVFQDSVAMYKLISVQDKIYVEVTAEESENLNLYVGKQP